ncbi:hypothetical protein [Bacillus seohaeanensis]|uniref:Uncharacterized protein n=1 Tax=Bacillus seohaeanensis TaxID=284580 RepID=A0ABW5RNY7_9BACI
MRKRKRLSETKEGSKMKESFLEGKKDSSVSYTPIYIQSNMPAVIIDRDEH